MLIGKFLNKEVAIPGMQIATKLLAPVPEYVLAPVPEYVPTPVPEYVLAPVPEYVLVPLSVFRYENGYGYVFGYGYWCKYVFEYSLQYPGTNRHFKQAHLSMKMGS